MDSLKSNKALVSVFVGLLLCSLPAVAMDTAFSYQARLDSGGSPANGTYDFRFFLYDAEIGGSQVGSTLYADDIVVSDGLFTVYLDFGRGTFDGTNLWLDVAVRPGASTDAYAQLAPRQAILPSPYALHSGTIEVGAVGSSEVADNSLTAADLAPNSVGTSEVADNSLTASDLAANSVGTSEIASSAVTSTEILNGTITYSDTNTGSVQRRVSSPCAVGSSIRAISSTGTVTCEVDTYNNIFHSSQLTANSYDGVDGSVTWTKTGDDSVCFLVRSSVRDTDSTYEFAACSITEETAYWKLTADTLTGEDNDVFCGMRCIYWYRHP